MSESESLGTSSTGSDAATDPFTQLLASMARPIPCVTGWLIIVPFWEVFVFLFNRLKEV